MGEVVDAAITPPPNRPVVSVRDWYFQDPKTREPTGPWSVAQLRIRWQRDRIDGLTMVWKSGMDVWVPLAEAKELKEELQKDSPDAEMKAEDADNVQSTEEKAKADSDEKQGASRGVKRKRRIHLDSLPITCTYTSNQGALLIYDSIDNDWKTSEIYEDLVAQEELPDVEEEDVVENASTMQAEPEKPKSKGDENLSAEAREALEELLADASGVSVVGSGGDGSSLLGLRGGAKKAAMKAEAAAVEAAVKAANPSASADDGAAEPATPLTAEQEAKAKKRREYRERKKLKRQAGLFIKARENRNVYVSGLPPDVTLQELEPVFKRGGVLRVDTETGGSKIRIYTDDQDRCKGDALVSYANAESVELAIQFLHEFELRPNCRIAVQEADFDDKETAPKLSTQELKEIASKRNVAAERKKYQAAKNMEKEAVSWSGEMDDGSGRKIVLLRHMFSLEEAEKEGPEFYTELAEEVQEECEKIGQVVKVTPIEGHKQGIVTVKFKSSSEAEECIRVMDGRFFGGSTVEASFYDGKTDLRLLGSKPTAPKPTVPVAEPAKTSADEPVAPAPAPAAASPPADDEQDEACWKELEASEKPASETKGANDSAAPKATAAAGAKPGEKAWEEWLAGSDSESDSDTRINVEE